LVLYLVQHQQLSFMQAKWIKMLGYVFGHLKKYLVMVYKPNTLWYVLNICFLSLLVNISVQKLKLLLTSHSHSLPALCNYVNSSLRVGWDVVHLVCQLLFGVLHQTWMMDDDECGAVGGMTGRGTEVLGENLPQCLRPP
jgi:hypothetical protein